MKTYLLFIMLAVGAVACKAKKSSAISSGVTAVVATTMGKVSHEFRPQGCETVIRVAPTDGQEEIVLIPKDKLSKQFDVHGMQIMFNYVTLRMPQPRGCSTGMPAEITDISPVK